MPTAADLADSLGARIVGENRPHPLRDIVDDSRAVGAGDVYLAIPGRVRHGLDFEDDVVAAGAALVVSDRPARALPTVVVGDPRRVAGPLADWFHGSPSRELTVHGVTGTNGKSSTAAMLHAGLLGAGREPGLVSGVEITGPGFTAAPTRTTPRRPSCIGPSTCSADPVATAPFWRSRRTPRCTDVSTASRSGRWR